MKKTGKIASINGLNLSSFLILVFFLIIFNPYNSIFRIYTRSHILIPIINFILIIFITLYEGRILIRYKLIFHENRIDFSSSLPFVKSSSLFYSDIDKLCLKGLILRIKSKKFSIGGSYIMMNKRDEIKDIVRRIDVN